MNSKKIILLIVEGKTEELALGPILRNLITDKRTHFKVVNSDITADKNTTVKNIGYKLTRLVKAFLGQIFLPSHLAEIIHITDTDGTFIADDAVLIKAAGEIEYTNENILTSNKHNIIARNLRKASVLRHLKNITELSFGKKQKIPYRLYYMACNFDHVLHDNANIAGRSKIDMAIAFSDRYYKNEQAFITFMCSKTILVHADYMTSWQMIEVGTLSLKRGSNFGLALKQYIKK